MLVNLQMSLNTGTYVISPYWCWVECDLVMLNNVGWDLNAAHVVTKQIVGTYFVCYQDMRPLPSSLCFHSVILMKGRIFS